MNINMPPKGHYEEKYEKLLQRKRQLQLARAETFYKERCKELEKEIAELMAAQLVKECE